MEWISVKDQLPTKQTEVVFFAKAFEWRTGLFTPKGEFSEENVFQYHEHWGDDCYHTLENVTHWMPLPAPPKEHSHD